MSASLYMRLCVSRCMRSNALLVQRMSSTTDNEIESKSTPINVSDTEHNEPTADAPKKVGGLAKAYEMFEKIKRGELESEIDDNESFASMMRKSKLMQLGDPRGRTVVGTIIDVVEDDLYIDFGGKFHCVCTRPNFQPKSFCQGVHVKLQLNDMEMTSSFHGSDKHVTLLEADSTLLGLHRSEKWDVS